MATNFVQDGKLLTTENDTGADLDSGGVLVVGGMIRVALNDIDDGDSGPAYAEGVFTLAANSSEAWLDGLPLYWDADNDELTATAGSHVMAGFAVGDKAASTATANVKLYPGGSSTAETTT